MIFYICPYIMNTISLTLAYHFLRFCITIIWHDVLLSILKWVDLMVRFWKKQPWWAVCSPCFLGQKSRCVAVIIVLRSLKGTISTGNTSSNHWFSGGIRSFSGVYQLVVCYCVFFLCGGRNILTNIFFLDTLNITCLLIHFSGYDMYIYIYIYIYVYILTPL